MHLRSLSDALHHSSPHSAPIGRRSFVAWAGGVAFLTACGAQTDALLGPESPSKGQLEKGSSFTVNVRDAGAIGDGVADDTGAFENAVAMFGEGGGTLLVPAGVYLIDPMRSIRLKDNMTLALAADAVLQAIPIVYHRSGVVHIEDVANVTVRGGTIIGERASHLGQGGEGGHGIRILGSSDVTIRGVTVKDCWGDGIYVARSAPYQAAKFAKHLYSERVTISKCVARNNRRQGLSIVACVGALVENSEFTDTNGTAPQSGIDLEPNRDCMVSDVVIRNCLFARNAGNGLQLCGNDIYGGTLTRITVEGNRSAENAQSGSFILRGTSEVRVQGNTFERNSQNGVRLQQVTYVDVESNVLRQNSRGNPNAFADIYLESGANYNTIRENRSTAQRSLVAGPKPSLVITPDCVGNVVDGNTSPSKNGKRNGRPDTGFDQFR